MTKRQGSVGSIGLAALVASTYFMVSGGPYGLEDLLQKTGYGASIAVLVITPLVWSLPTSLMVGELAAAIPAEGGYYAWVKRAMGPFWGFQEAWLSLAASVFDMGIYPALFAAYLGRLFPVFATPHAELAVRAAVLFGSVAWNLRGARALGTTSEVLGLSLLVPFLVFVVLAVARGSSAPALPHGGGDLMGGVVVAMWNTMGWDNASTIAGEVERPQRTYPLAMLSTLLLVVASYVIPVGAAWAAHVDLAKLSTGGWADAAGDVGGSGLEAAVVFGGMIGAVGMLSALILSYSRVPMVLAADGYLPSALARTNARGVPTRSVLLCGVLFSLSLALSFERLVLLDIVLYGLSLVLEFVALVILRVRERTLPRPFRVPFGVPGCVVLGIGPAVLLVVAFVRNAGEEVGGTKAIWVAVAIIALGPVAYLATSRSARRRRHPPSAAPL